MSGALILSIALFLHFCPGADTKMSTSSKNLEQDLAKLFDEILLQVFPTSPSPYSSAVDDARTAGRAVTGRRATGSSLQTNSLQNSEFDSDSNKQEEDMAKIFDRILEKRNQDSSLSSRNARNKLTTVVKGTLPEEVTPDVHYRSLQCNQLLQFLQKNIIIASLAGTAILAATVLLVLLLTAYIRRRQPLFPPANMTYNIFIMNGKSWWQKSQEKNLGKLAEKQLQQDSCV